MSKGCSKCGTENADEARFCRACGVELTAATVVGGSGKPRLMGVALGAIVVALVAAAIAWFVGSRPPPAPSFDSAPPPSVLGASSPAQAAPTKTEATTPSPAAPTRAASSDLWEPIETPASAPLPAPQKPPARVPSPTRSQTPARAASPAAKPAATPVPIQASTQALTPAPAPPRAAAPRTVQDRCTASNALLRGICESRECMRAEHAGESVCQRIRATEDRRREQ